MIDVIQTPIFSISACLIPRVVTAGVQILTPDKRKAVLGSKGTVLQLATIPAFSSAIATFFPKPRTKRQKID